MLLCCLRTTYRHGGEAADVASAAVAIMADLLNLTVNWVSACTRQKYPGFAMAGQQCACRRVGGVPNHCGCSHCSHEFCISYSVVGACAGFWRVGRTVERTVIQPYNLLSLLLLVVSAAAAAGPGPGVQGRHHHSPQLPAVQHPRPQNRLSSPP